jgi:cysteine desulfurase / selenocysteine lyase
MDTIRLDFPFFQAHRQKKQPLLYFDNGATTQKPQQVIDALTHWYSFESAPVHRGIYSLSEESTYHYEEARSIVARFIGAFDDEIIFTKGTTEGINFIADAWAALMLKPGDEIIITELEHHSNILPWIRLAQKNSLILKYIPIMEDGLLDYDSYRTLLTNNTKLVSFTLNSNVLGTYPDATYIIKHAHAVGAKVLVDAAQAVAHIPIQVHELGADFLVFSGHKMVGPTGIGVLYNARHMHEQVKPYQVGGGMVFEVNYHSASWLKPPRCYEAGTPPIAQAIGLAAAITYIQNTIDFGELKEYEALLCTQLIEGLADIPGVTLLGPLEQLTQSGHMISFVTDRIHPHDIAAYLDVQGICVRAGHHCAQILHKKLGIDGSVRVSFYAYNTSEEVAQLIDALRKILM